MEPKTSKHLRITRAINTLKETLTKLEWEPESIEEGNGFYVDFGPPHIPVSSLLAAVSIAAEQLIIYFNFGIAVPPERRDDLAKLLTRINWGLKIGNFEMDYNDGQVHFKSSINFCDTELTGKMIQNAILPAMIAIETYGDALIEVIAKGKNATDWNPI
ncbi:YbjN domain-containing protein [Methylobacter sp. S3L5C]|uniref:YbjN domain-containing protein n=1 Tax=Methylobacter sp. S3L5C TaxID=2839024 RepID=UPI001FAB6675|nr:YbjN domain-containing protein [Methylobacter sp. S3L5C]UOA09438.1 YbjN domain-containing protein [Methylobacter sp. S3L5C]